MAYTVHNFEQGDVLYAEQLNEMDVQIAANEESIENSVSLNMLAENYSANKTYSIGDYVIYNNELYTCIYEITAPEGWNSTHWRIANLGNSISGLKNTLNDFEEAMGEFDPGLSINNISGVTKISDTSANVISSSGYTGIKIQSTSNYDTYYFIANKDMSLYFGNILANYLALCIGRAYTKTQTDSAGNTYLISSNPVRYRKSEGNLPTMQSPLSVNVGDAIAITITAGSTDLIYGIAKDYLPNPNYLFYSKTATAMNIVINKAVFTLNKITNNTINLNVWRITQCSIEDYTMWLNQDSESVVKLLGEDDFLGGYHGDEQQTGIKIYVDNTEITENSIQSGAEFSEILIFIESDIYHCNTSASAGTKCFKRNTYLKFNKDGLTQITSWEAVNDVSVTTWYYGMLSCEETNIVGDSTGTKVLKTFYTNHEPYPHELGSNIVISEYNKEATFVTTKGTISMESFVDGYSGSAFVRNYSSQSREKAYFVGISNENGVSINTGDLLVGGSMLKFS